MMRNIVLSLLIATGLFIAAWQIVKPTPGKLQSDSTAEHDRKGGETAEGPHGGKLFQRGGFAVELVLYESGVPPEYHVYAYNQGSPVPPASFEAEVTLTRLDGQVDRIGFAPQADYLRGDGVVTEPHSFDVAVQASYEGQTYRWAFSSYEGRTEIPAALAREAGIATETAGPAVLSETIPLTGRVQADPARIAQVRARFPGMAQEIRAEIGQRVQAGDVLARIQSNESLQTYSLKAPIDGVVLSRNLNAGAPTGEGALFVIADLSEVWVELDVFSRDLERIGTGQAVVVEALDGSRVAGVVSYVSPLAAHASQTVQARVVLANPARRLRPGQFVRAEVIVAEHEVPLAVRQSAIQRFRDFQVVFARYGDTYEVRMLELGRQNAQWAEVLGGLKPGTEYVTANSYLIKADVEKSGASHDH